MKGWERASVALNRSFEKRLRKRKGMKGEKNGPEPLDYSRTTHT